MQRPESPVDVTIDYSGRVFMSTNNTLLHHGLEPEQAVELAMTLVRQALKGAKRRELDRAIGELTP